MEGERKGKKERRKRGSGFSLLHTAPPYESIVSLPARSPGLS
jgi:hypothetical protein